MQFLNRLLAQVRSSVALREERRLTIPQIYYPPDLPITARKDTAHCGRHPCEPGRGHRGGNGFGQDDANPEDVPGSGLGHRGEDWLHTAAPRGGIVHFPPHRGGTECPNWGPCEVGCTIRFDDRSSPQTYIKLMTDGILLAETQSDPLLSEYNCIIIDEAHERSLNIDFLLGYLKTLLAKRKDLKLIITSATIDTGTFSRAFNDAPIIEVSGRLVSGGSDLCADSTRR